MSGDGERGRPPKKGAIRQWVGLVFQAFGTPGEAVGWKKLGANFSVIRFLWATLKLSDDQKGTSLVVRAQPLADLRTAWAYRHLQENDFLALIHQRQRQTFLTALGAGGLASVLFLVWAIEMVFFRWTGSRLLSSIGFLPFLGLLGFASLWNCSLNWQLRTRQLASFREFLNRADSLFPRLP
ncbi:hypothetical protein J2D73_10270 [Acetobacter sacchari]|uniref:Uncharacterized protein n=1 Tax=Acetobacter sacchari TaxID=2661687 RepID=A0ABS3LWB5_9PROT|nr:hypothetical protein [Acetobacter sacchari]MBO1360183.1 hypothetical protein [Acetobacter sacchari]